VSRKILLTRGKAALVDAADYEWLSQWNWYAQRNRTNWYAARGRQHSDGRGPGIILMHRAILDAPANLQADHISGDGLDNRRTNLRLATYTLNASNHYRRRSDHTSGLPMGVYPNKRRFQAKIMRAGRWRCLGTFDKPEQAHAAYLAARSDNIAAEEAIVASLVLSEIETPDPDDPGNALPL